MIDDHNLSVAVLSHGDHTFVTNITNLTNPNPGEDLLEAWPSDTMLKLEGPAHGDSEQVIYITISPSSVDPQTNTITSTDMSVSINPLLSELIGRREQGLSRQSFKMSIPYLAESCSQQHDTCPVEC